MPVRPQKIELTEPPDYMQPVQRLGAAITGGTPLGARVSGDRRIVAVLADEGPRGGIDVDVTTGDRGQPQKSLRYTADSLPSGSGQLLGAHIMRLYSARGMPHKDPPPHLLFHIRNRMQDKQAAAGAKVMVESLHVSIGNRQSKAGQWVYERP